MTLPTQNANPNHDERGRFATGPGSPLQELPQWAKDDLLRASQATLSRPLTILGTDLSHRKISDYLEAHGQKWEATPLPAGIERGTPKECYTNATHLILRHPELSYCEGIAYPAGVPRALGILHAWAVTKDGKVVDPTLDNPEKAKYFGVKYDNDKYLKHIMKTKTYGVLGGSDKSAERVLGRGGI